MLQKEIQTRYKWDENDYIKIIPSRLVIISFRGLTRDDELEKKNEQKIYYNHIISNEVNSRLERN